MTVKAAGYVEGYVVAQRIRKEPSGFEWTANVTPAESYSDAEGLAESRGPGYFVYAMVEVPMDDFFDAMVYGRAEKEEVK